MSNKIMISRKFVPFSAPIGGTVLTWLLFEKINPHGTAKGILLTLFISWVALIWFSFFYQFTYEYKEPEWKD